MQHTKYNTLNANNERRVTGHESRKSAGSALILTVVLTSLLAIVGVLFLMMARINRITASSISKNKELDSAVETVIAKISEELILDVPGVAGQEYYDYPDVNNAWLASLEPYEKTAGNYYWRQISDVTKYFSEPCDVEDIQAVIIGEHDTITDPNNAPADADGDGVADSKWVELADITSSGGKPVYAAIRVVDNGGMLNVNTAYKFDPIDPDVNHINGSNQMQINLMALAGRPPLPTWPVGNPHTPDDETDLREARANGVDVDPYSLQYQSSVIWSYGEPAPYTPFDVSDELEIRYRFLLNHTGIDTRLEDWGGEFRDTVITTPVDSGGLDEWFKRASFNPAILNPSIDWKDPNYYAYRHIATTYNMDRVINPAGGKMLNVNIATAADVCDTIIKALTGYYDPSADVNAVAAQIAVNMIDYRDSDSNVTSLDVDGITYYGFERPCIYISEIAHTFVEVISPGEPSRTYKSYAIELDKPYTEDIVSSGDWRLNIDGVYNIPIDWSDSSRHFFVAGCLDRDAPLLIVKSDDCIAPPFDYLFDADSNISLLRRVDVDGVSVDIVVDSVHVPGPNDATGWLTFDGNPHSIQRDITPHKWIRRLWAGAAEATTPTLGIVNSYFGSDPNIQAYPANGLFTNIGEIGMVFVRSAYSQGPNPIGSNDTEATVRIDFTKPEFRQLFKYLTVFDPAVYSWNDPDETRIKGRININTAPWFVLAQLPWVSQRKTFSTYELAKEMVGYRDDINGFESIGQLCQVGIYDPNNYLGIDYYSRDGVDQAGFPDLTTPDQASGDGAVDDFEEGDLIFSRISNLVTVRSDVFTAYILVRIGTDGPQKRVIAIFDRSNVRSSDDGGMRVLAVQPVADPR